MRRERHGGVISVKPLASAAAIVVLAGLVSSCDGSASGSGDSRRSDVVASTSAWGSIAAAVGGTYVTVSSIISSPDQDPHSFEASARTLLEIKEADLLIENGGGYDDFMDSMISSSKTTAPVLNAVTVSGHTASSGQPLNEHVWYDFPTVKRMALDIASKLTKLQPRHAADFTANASRLVRGLDRLVTEEHQVRAAHAGTGVAITEPVPLYMLEAMGLRNETPAVFSEAVEEGTDVSARTLADTLALYSRHEVSALVYNEQTTGAVTEQVKAAADAAGVPVVPVTETLPMGTTYLQWMTRNVADVRQALGS